MELGAKLEVVERLSRLREQGALTDEEFDAAKSNILSATTALLSQGVNTVGNGAGHAPSVQKWLLTALGAAVIGVGGFFLVKPGSTPSDALSGADITNEPTGETDSGGEPADALAGEATSSPEPATTSPEAEVNTVDAQSTATQALPSAATTNSRQATEQTGTGSRQLTPMASLQSYFRDDDYPSSAMDAGEQGAVGFTLTVAPNGRVSNCAITSTSGSTSLDRATCRIMIARARFQPALDLNGVAIEATTSSSVGWRLAG